MARVTVINDSSEFLDLMRDLLGSLGHGMVGFEAIQASIQDVADSRPDLLVIDLQLQDTPQVLSGWELLVMARAHPDLMSIPVILCTADVLELRERAEELERIAGVHVRTKPFDFDDMCDLITRLLDRPA